MEQGGKVIALYTSVHTSLYEQVQLLPQVLHSCASQN